MNGVPCTIVRHVTRRSVSMWRTFRRWNCASATASTSRSTGQRRTDGKEPILSSASSDAAFLNALAPAGDSKRLERSLLIRDQGRSTMTKHDATTGTEHEDHAGSRYAQSLLDRPT